MSQVPILQDFVTVAKVDEIPPGTGRTVDVKGVWIALFNVDGTFYAVDNACPHAGGPLGEGHLTGDMIECPWHGWSFSVRTGERRGNSNITVACCPVRIEGDCVQIALPPGFI
ncbi:putative Rieske-type ferredoxin [Nitrospira sp. KM1]|uniref:Rieske (2Fe-2S) protein n=1 Tax=Nitrospira sp. KM1 TaxID=1936990 RepID=UPI0013A75E6E|nr:Rieske 2Fe-2S domain-containing protein [Nitrospira sp. KM1]BCA53702.1 putative Rieske-type ferredoxin [Nitrospira sp. KM1]